MAVTATPYRHFKDLLATKQIDLSDTAANKFKAIPLAAGYSPNFDSHQFVSDLTNEVTGSGASRQGLTTVAVAEAGGNLLTWTSDPFTFSASGGDVVFRKIAIAQIGVSDAASPLICLIDLGANQTITDGHAATLTPDATSGWVKF